jgi:sugar phosphate isomerase/epimerase
LLRYAAEILPYHDIAFEDAIRDLAEIGFKEVNLWSSVSPLAHHISPEDNPQKILAILDKYKIQPCGLTVYGNNQDQILERIQFASELGIDTVTFDCEAHYEDFVGSFLPPIVEAGAKAGVRIAVENHLTVPFSADFEAGGNEDQRWDAGVDTFAQIKSLLRDIDDPYLGICLAPPHLWVMEETISEIIAFLAERKRLFYYYIWDIDRNYKRGVDGLNFGPGDKQLPRPDGTLDHRFLLAELSRSGYDGVASVKCHGTHGWSLEKIGKEVRASDAYIRDTLKSLAL